MALSRALIRSYAAEYNTQPEPVLCAANHRILMDTRADLFVTVFYGILDPVTRTLTYNNAGHNPPYLGSVSWQERLLEIARANVGTQANQNLPTGQGFSAQDVQEALTTEIHGFVSDAPQFDDITLMIVVRES
jgi:serine phosphatase RsbU (regulator of sigma subunit)